MYVPAGYKELIELLKEKYPEIQIKSRIKGRRKSKTKEAVVVARLNKIEDEEGKRMYRVGSIEIIDEDQFHEETNSADPWDTFVDNYYGYKALVYIKQDGANVYFI